MTVELPLCYERTLPLALVHKTSHDAVLLTDCIATSRIETVLGAQVPRWHPIYQERSIGRSGYDIAALVEICRQACFAIAHTQFELPIEGNRFQFLFRELRAQLSKAAVATPHENGHPVRLAVYSKVLRETRTSGRTSGLDWRFDLKDPSGSRIATLEIRQSFVERAFWMRIRNEMRERHGAGLRSSIEIPPDSELRPDAVGRVNAENLALQRIVNDGDLYKAEARIDPRHPALFDRASADHIYAMTQLEAARQLAIYAASNAANVSAFRLVVSSCDASFVSIGELNVRTDAYACVSSKAAEHIVDVSLKQADRTISKFQFSLVEPGN